MYRFIAAGVVKPVYDPSAGVSFFLQFLVDVIAAKEFKQVVVCQVVAHGEYASHIMRDAGLACLSAGVDGIGVLIWPQRIKPEGSFFFQAWIAVLAQVVDFFKRQQGKRHFYHAGGVEIPGAVHVPEPGFEMWLLLRVAVDLCVNNLNFIYLRVLQDAVKIRCVGGKDFFERVRSDFAGDPLRWFASKEKGEKKEVIELHGSWLDGQER